jgi:hypothetical protein
MKVWLTPQRRDIHAKYHENWFTGARTHRHTDISYHKPQFPYKIKKVALNIDRDTFKIVGLILSTKYIELHDVVVITPASCLEADISY